MKKQNVYTIIFAVSIVISIVIIAFYTYALFETNKPVPISSDLAKWNIKVNDTMVTDNVSNQNTFSIGSIDWQSGGHVRPGKAAPGSTGSFEIEIDPTDTQVSFVYMIQVDLTGLDNDQFVVSSVTETNGNEFIRIGENTYVGIARLADNVQGQKYNVLINLTWYNDDNNNDADYELGSRADAGVNVPVEIQLMQYIGTETFIPYQEGPQ